MCLNQITNKEFITKEEIPVWKVCAKDYFGNKIIGIFLNVRNVKIKRGLIKDPNCQSIFPFILNAISEETYETGFHCFLSKEDAKGYFKSKQNFWSNSEQIIKFYIPKGTKVTTGLQSLTYCKHIEVYVTPVLLKK